MMNVPRLLGSLVLRPLALLNPHLIVLSVVGLPARVDCASFGIIHGGVRMISGEERVAFVWRCPGCSGVYEGEGLLFLHTDGMHRYCPCGGQLVESVEPATERHYRLVIPEHLRGTLLHRQLEWREAGETVEVTVGGRRDRHINIFCAN
jgi:hypothetical protein